MNNIMIKNIGAIESVSIPVPKGGGVVVLRGRNGSGKSTALDAIQSAVSGKGKPPLRDKTAKGEIQAGGVSLTVQKSVRRSGQLEVTSLDSRLSIADLVDPGIADPLRADASRIKALVNLSGASIDPGDLHGFPEELLDGLNLADPVAAMAELKKRLDIGAREYEKLAKEAGDKAAALLESAGDPGPVPDQTALHATLAAAQRKVDQLMHQQQQAIAAQARATEARGRLAALPADSVNVITRLLDDANSIVERCRAAAQKLKEQYNAAVEDYKSEVARRDVLQARLESAQQSDALRHQLEMQIAESLTPAPSESEFSEAEAELETAQAALSNATRLRVAAETHKKGAELAEEAQRLDEESKLLRQKARYTEEVLSEIIADLGCPLRCIDGRLVTDTARGPTYYGDLSEGERWKMALDIAVASVGKNGLIVVPQAAWEGLDPTNRGLIADHAKRTQTVVITAECDDGDLVATPHADAA